MRGQNKSRTEKSVPEGFDTPSTFFQKEYPDAWDLVPNMASEIEREDTPKIAALSDGRVFPRGVRVDGQEYFSVTVMKYYFG